MRDIVRICLLFQTSVPSDLPMGSSCFQRRCFHCIRGPATPLNTRRNGVKYSATQVWQHQSFICRRLQPNVGMPQSDFTWLDAGSDGTARLKSIRIGDCGSSILYLISYAQGLLILLAPVLRVLSILFNYCHVPFFSYAFKYEFAMASGLGCIDPCVLFTLYL